MPVFKPRTRLWGSCLLAASVLPLSCGAMAAPTAAATDTGAKASEAVPYTALADMLENEATRNQLIQVLRDQAQKKTAPAETRVSAAASLPRRAAEATQAVAEKLAARVSATMAALTFAGGDQAGPAFDAGALLAGLVRFLLVAVTTVVLWFILRLLIRPVFARAGRWAGNGETGLSIAIHRISAIAISFVVDVGVVVLACAAGYAVGLFVVGDNQGVIGTRESLFINAFAMIEIVKAIIRTLLPAHYEGLRLFPVSDTVAAWWSKRLRWFTGFIGYGLLVVVPIANAVVTPGLGVLLNLLIMLVAYIYALRVIVKNRVLLRERLEQSARAQGGVMEVLLRIAARTWHLVAIAYFTVVFVVTQLRPEDALPFLVAATVQSLIAIAIAAALTGMLDKAVGSRVRLPGRLRQRLPHLEWRLNTNMPRTLHGLRLVIILVAVLALLDFWEIFNLGAWIASDAGAHAIAVTNRVLLILAEAALSWMDAISVI
ncbi:MAG: mechanosensitive channel protein, partial [Salinisphaera sp.]|nr:mechanosensitive channel protein [Salinisphaera sp.]